MSRPGINRFRVLLIAVPVAITVAFLAPYAAVLFPAPEMEPVGQSPSDPIRSTPYLAAGIERPATVTAKDATLSDDEDVIGVVVNGRPRAYRIKAMVNVFGKVVNDLIDTVPVTVTYCDQADCVQAFTSPKRGEPLDIWTGGFHKQLMLMTGNTFFWQATGKCCAPDRADESLFQTYSFDRVSWRAWRSTYPATDVYVGAN